MILHLQFEFLAECFGIQALGAASKEFDRLFRTLIRHFEPAPGIPTDRRGCCGCEKSVFELPIIAALSMEVRVALDCSPFFVRAGSAVGNRCDSGGRHRSDEIPSGDPRFGNI